MSRNPVTWLTALVALALFGLAVFVTIDALKASGAWSSAFRPRARAFVPSEPDPFANVSVLLERPLPALPAGTQLRDPFSAGSTPATIASRKPVVRKPAVPAPAPRPVLTAIVWDSDPRAVLRWKGRDLTVHSGGLFDDFQVLDITRDHVTLRRGTESIVLQRKLQGD